MQLGVHLPQNELGLDREAIRRFVQEAEAIGYHYLIMGEHVLGSDAAEQDENRPYTADWVWHEPFVLFAWLSALTQRIQFMPSVMVISQRQGVLVAKQAAELDFLSGGRLMLGVGTGWSTVEYEALGVDFATRGRRIDEQIQLMRALWGERLVDFDGEFHTVRGGGLNPRPTQQIPIWYGGMSNRVLDRIGRLCDGWNVRRTDFLLMDEAEQEREFRRKLGRIHAAAEGAGRDPSRIQIGVAIDVAGRTAAEQAAEAERWRERGATHAAIRTTHADLDGLDQHLDAIRAFHEAFDG